MTISEKTGSYTHRFIHELSPKQQAIRVGGMALACTVGAGMVAGALENYRGYNGTDCYGTVRVYPEDGQLVDDITKEIASRLEAPQEDISKIFLHDNPNALRYDVIANGWAIDGTDPVITPERCD